MSIVERIATKVTSGQWILTVSGGWTFAWMACHDMLPKEAVIGLLTLIVNSYFRRDRGQEQKP